MSDPKKPEADVEALIADFDRSGMRELHVRSGEVEIYLSANPNAPGLDAAPSANLAAAAPAPVAPTAGSPVPAASAPASASASAPIAAPGDIPAGGVVVTAPYLGTFYRSPKPGAPVYVDIGSVVTAETDLCLVEVMKLFTAVRAEAEGRIHAILAQDGEMVSADQPLFVIVPA